MKLKSFFIFSLVFCILFSSIPMNKASAISYSIDFDINSKSVYLVNLDTGISVYEKDKDKKCYPASTTKIMTYIIVTENIKDLDNTKVTVKQSILNRLNGTGSSTAGLIGGETLTVTQLLNCLMIPSGNDAALVLADYVGGGSITNFVKMMNKKAKELGCENTHFMNPHGLHDPDHYTTASDLAKITEYAMTLPKFTEITSTTVSDCLGEDRPLITTNSLIDEVRGGDYFYKYATGTKTGCTGDDSGYCLVSTAVYESYSYLCVTLGADYSKNGEQLENGAMKDAKNLFRWAFTSLQLTTVIDEKTIVDEVNINFAWGKDRLKLSPATSYSTILPSDIKASSIDKVYHLPESVNAPVKAGDKIGTVTLKYANNELATVDLVAAETIDQSDLLVAMDGISKVVSNPWFIVCASLLVLLVIIYIIILTIYSKRCRNRRKVKTYRRM